VKQGADYEYDSCRPISPSLCPGARLDLLRLPLWCGGLAGAFRLFRRALGAKWGWMLGWVVAGGGSA